MFLKFKRVCREQIAEDVALQDVRLMQLLCVKAELRPICVLWAVTLFPKRFLK